MEILINNLLDPSQFISTHFIHILFLILKFLLISNKDLMNLMDKYKQDPKVKTIFILIPQYLNLYSIPNDIPFNTIPQL